MTYEQLKHYLRGLRNQGLITNLTPSYCGKTRLRTIKFKLNGEQIQFDCSEDESGIDAFVTEIKNKIGN